MSNHLAIATVTATLQRWLAATVQQDVPGAGATVLRPEPNPPWPPGVGVNIYLHQVTPNTAWRSDDLPTRNRGGHAVQRPTIALDLHYILTFHGDELQFQPQRVLGSVVRTLHARPFLTRQSLEATTTLPNFADADLHEAIELVKLTPAPMSLEELSQLWSIFFQTPYSLSMPYVAMVVFVEAEETFRRALPVRERAIDVFTFHRPTIDRVVPAAGENAPIELGDVVVLRGTQLSGPILEVRVGAARLQPDSVSSTQIRVTLNHPDLRAGVLGVQVRYQNGIASNMAALVLRPSITVDQGNVTSTEIPLAFAPPVDRDQPVVMFLNEQDPPAARAPFTYSFEAPAHNGIGDPNVPDTTDITFEIEDVEPETYLVRVHVGGAESVLGTAEVMGEIRYVSPTVNVP